MVNSQGQIKVTIAIGSPGYMPSEQSGGKPHFSSDVYAVGIIAIAALSGVFPITTDAQTNEIAWRDLVTVNPKLANIIDTMVRYDFRFKLSYNAVSLFAVKTLSTSSLRTRYFN
ncbi:MAG: hypothetical protein WBA39_05460 [Rivularia sp. (in: cyanobacteria)]